MSTTYRIFERDSTVSVATAVRTKDNRIFQVKPEKEAFAGLEQWMDAVGLTDGRRLEKTVGSSATRSVKPVELNADQTLVMKAVQRAAVMGHKARPQYAATTTIGQQIADLKWKIEQATKQKRKYQLDANRATYRLGILYEHMYNRRNYGWTLEQYCATAGFQNLLRLYSSTPLTEWYNNRNPSMSVVDALKELELKVDPAYTSMTGSYLLTWIESYQAQLAPLEAQVAANPSKATEVTYTMVRRPQVLLYVKSGEAFLPIYYSKDFKKMTIRADDGNLHNTFYDVDINIDYALPKFYVMSAQNVLVPLPA